MQKISEMTTTATSAGEFTNGSVSSGESPTILDAGWFNTVQRELISVVEGAGLPLDPDNDAQVLAAIKVISSDYYVDSGSANAIVITPNPELTALVDGQAFDIAVAAANTGAVTLKVNSLTSYPVWGAYGVLQAGEIGAAKGVIRVIWSASNSAFLITGQNTKGPLQVAPATQTYHAVQLTQLSAAISAALLLHGQVEITASTTWTCPAGVTTIWVDASAPGGGGAYSASGTTGGGGGGGGQSVTGYALTVVPGTTYQITFGSPGVGGTSSSVNGGSAGSLKFDTLLTLVGGYGGQSNGTAGASGGSGATAGIAGNITNSVPCGGAGGSSNYGSGGQGGTGAAYGQIGGGFGSGGGGGANGNGGRGGYGWLKIYW